VLANRKAVRETSRRAKTDRIEAKSSRGSRRPDSSIGCGTPDEAARARWHPIVRRGAMVRHRTRGKNQGTQRLASTSSRRQPMSDLFGVKGRAWLAECVGGLALDERLTVGAGLRQIDFIAAELAEPAKILAADALSEPTRCG